MSSDEQDFSKLAGTKERRSQSEITKEDVKAIQSIERKSISQFTSEEIKKTEAFARKYWDELKTKSPFFRAWFGDWREYDKSTVNVVTQKGATRGTHKNTDTGWDINISAKVFNETNVHQSAKNKMAKVYLDFLDGIVNNAVLLDSYTISEEKAKSENSAMMHSLYALVDKGDGIELLKLYVEEFRDVNTDGTIKRSYQLQNITKAPMASAKVQGVPLSPFTSTKSAITCIVSDLFNLVKTFDKDFKYNPVHPALLNEDGTPRILYHGTDASFNAFDMSKGRANMDIQGAFFSPYEIDAQGYGKNLGAYYLNLRNPADEGTAYKALNMFKGQNNAGIKAREYLIKQGYDGVYNGYDEYIAFYPEQIKSATDNIGTFDEGNPDIRYAIAGRSAKTADISNIRKKSENYTERGVKNGQPGDNLLLGNSGRGSDESAREQTRQLQPFERENQGKTEAERKRTAKELFAEQKIRQEVISTQKGKIRINTINADSYDADMLSIVDAYKEDGIETVLFVGKGERAFDGGKKFNINGFAIDNKIYLRYDGKIAPQNLKKHELVHIKWDTADMQTVRENILGKMSKDEQSAILKEQRYLDYAEIYGDDVDAILEEFIADTLAGMNDYTDVYADTVVNYWSDEKTLDIFSPGMYTESIDAGGNKAVLDYIKYGENNNAGDGSNAHLPNNAFQMERERADKSKNSVRKNDFNSKGAFGPLGKRTRNFGFLYKSGNYPGEYLKWNEGIQASKNTNRRTAGPMDSGNDFLRSVSNVKVADVDLAGNKVSDYVKEYFDKTVTKTENGVLIPFYHGTDKDFEYFKIGDLGFHVGSHEQASNRNSDVILEVYINAVNPAVLKGHDPMNWNAFPAMSTLKKSGILTEGDIDEFLKLGAIYDKGYDAPGNVWLRNKLIDKGYDSIIYSNEYEGEGYSILVFNPNQIKLTENRRPSEDSRLRYATESIGTGGDAKKLSIDSFKQLMLPKQEYAMVSKAIMAKNAGLKDSELKSVDYVYAADNFYVYENKSIGVFTVVDKLNPETEQTSINYIMEDIDNGNVTTVQGLSGWAKAIRSREGSNYRNNGRFENRRAKMADDRLSISSYKGRQTNGDTGGNPNGISKNTPSGKIRFSISDDGQFDLFDFAEGKYSDEELRTFATEANSELIKKHGAVKQGENPVRNVTVPKKIAKDKPVSQFARTMMEAGVTPDENVSDFEVQILNGTMTHEVITNKKAAKYATDRIKYLGFEEAMKEWETLSRAGKVGKNEIALGMELYNQCITKKDVRAAMKIAAELVSEATRAGQTLQATRMLKQMTPDGQLYYIEKSLEKMNDEFRDRLGDKYKDIIPDEKIMEDFLTAENEDKRNEAYDRLCKNIADQIPSTFIDKWNSWRYLAMLGNPRTHIRNIVGNAVFLPAVRLNNYVAATLEAMARVDKSKRVHSFTKSKEAVEFAKSDFEAMVKVLQGENAKYAVTGDIESKRTIFKTKWLENLRLANFKWLEAEDMFFLKKHYVDALARIITVRGIDVKSASPDVLDKARAYAVKEAQAATYRDANALAEALNKIQRRAASHENKAVRASGVLIEGVMPFKKTPLNIAKQDINYSPIGLLNGILKTFKKFRNGESYSTSEVIDTLPKGLTGTALLLLGYFLSAMGLIEGSEDEAKKKKDYDKMLGEQDYAIKIGDNSYTIDWMTPVCLPLFIGVELNRLTEDEFSFGKVVEAVSRLTDPLLELSVFSGLSSTIESAQYSDTNEIFTIGSDMLASYFTQALPTIGGQFSRMIDNTKREYYYVDKNSDMPKTLQSFIGQAASKIPFASYLFAPQVDEWGREKTYGGTVERVIENTISPGYYSKAQYTAVDEELLRLYEKTGETSVLPTKQQKYYVENKEYYYMSAKDYAEVKKIRGRRSFELVHKFINSPEYKKLNDDERVEKIANLYKDAGTYAKDKMLEKVKANSEK